jgi:hypothetical protein
VFPPKKQNPRPRQTASKPGPSSAKPATKTKLGQKKIAPTPKARTQTVETEEGDDGVELLDDDDDDDARSTVQKPQTDKVNTDKTTTKGRGKTKAEPKRTASIPKMNGVNGKGVRTEGEDSDEDEDIQLITRVAPPPPLAVHKPTMTSNNSLTKEIERLKKQLAAVCDLLLSPLVGLMVKTLGCC